MHFAAQRLRLDPMCRGIGEPFGGRQRQRGDARAAAAPDQPCGGVGLETCRQRGGAVNTVECDRRQAGSFAVDGAGDAEFVAERECRVAGSE